MFSHKLAAAAVTAALAALTFSAQAQTASGKFTCDGETYNIESAVARWVPYKDEFTVWAFASKLSDADLKAFAFFQSRVIGDPQAFSDKAFAKAVSEIWTKTRAIKHVMLSGYLVFPEQKVEWTNLRRNHGVLMNVVCLKNEHHNFQMSPGGKLPGADIDIVKAFKSFDFPLKDGATVKFQTIAFKHDGNPQGIKTKVTWDYKVDAKVYVVE